MKEFFPRDFSIIFPKTGKCWFIVSRIQCGTLVYGCMWWRGDEHFNKAVALCLESLGMKSFGSLFFSKWGFVSIFKILCIKIF